MTFYGGFWLAGRSAGSQSEAAFENHGQLSMVYPKIALVALTPDVRLILGWYDWYWVQYHIAKTLRLILIWYLYDMKVLDQCLIDVDLRVCAFWDGWNYLSCLNRLLLCIFSFRLIFSNPGNMDVSLRGRIWYKFIPVAYLCLHESSGCNDKGVENIWHVLVSSKKYITLSCVWIVYLSGCIVSLN